jgi:hypothetical protein
VMLCSTNASEILDEVQVGTQRRPAKLYRQMPYGSESMLAPSVWRQMLSVSLCLHPQDPQVGQPVTGQAHTSRVERGVAAMDMAVRQRSSGTMEGCRRCNMLPHFPRRRQPMAVARPKQQAARSLLACGAEGSSAFPRHSLLGETRKQLILAPPAVGPGRARDSQPSLTGTHCCGGCFERCYTGSTP